VPCFMMWDMFSLTDGDHRKRSVEHGMMSRCV
jgi:hypothetical protein